MVDVYEKVERETGVKADADTRLESLGFDSLELVEFFHELDMPTAAVAECDTIGDVIDYLEAGKAS